MSIEDLKGKIEEFKTTLDSIQRNRTIWRRQTKKLIANTLNCIKDNYKLDWTVQVTDWTENSEGVNITFIDSPSGIIEKSEISSHEFIKKGGSLLFAQAYNGEVYVLILYPVIENLVEETENKVLDRLHPDQISKDFVIEKVADFLDEMIRWEKSTYGNQVGFKVGE